jgi:hypothetical protein
MVLDRDQTEGLTADRTLLPQFTTEKERVSRGPVEATAADVPATDTWLSRSGSSPPLGAATRVNREIAEAIATGLASLAASIDAKSDNNPYVIAEALDKLTYVLDDTSPQPALYRIADALETIARPIPVGLWIILHEKADTPSRVHIAGQILGCDLDGALWIEWDYGTVWHGSLDLDTEGVDYYATYPAFREALDEIRAESSDRRANERTARAATE